jgi:hypothetical protein
VTPRGEWPRAAWTRWKLLLPAALVVVSFLPNLWAALPRETYFFRDFTLTYFPLRSLFARAVSEGGWPFWNPLSYQGCALLPVLYPLEIVQVLWPGPAFVSWLLTIHFPIAALCAFGLARSLGVSRWGAFASGAVYALGGLCLSSLNLHWFLQALALAPAVVLTTRRAAVVGGRALPLAGLALGLSISTLAVEFVAQAFAIGVVLALVAAPSRRAVGRLALVAVTGLGLAALPIALMLGIIGESLRGAGLPADMVFQNSLHPLVLLQTLVPDLPGAIAHPLEAWWGGRLYAGGSPYFLTLYLGPVAVGLAAFGVTAFPKRTRGALIVLSILGLLYALGPSGGLAIAARPVLKWFRFPVKALLTPYLCAALWAGAGLDRLRRGEGLGRLALLSGLTATVLAAAGLGAALFHGVLGAWLDVSPRSEALMSVALRREAAVGVAFSLMLAALALAMGAGRLQPGRGAAAAAILLVADLWRGGAGVNPQTSTDFFAPAPGLASLLGDLNGGRVFSLGVDSSPAMQRLLSAHRAGVGRASFLVSRRMLVPFTNLLDRIELAEGTDRLSFVPTTRPSLPPAAYAPGAIGLVLPRLRDDAVTRIVSLDPLESDDLHLRGTVPAGPEGLMIRVYDVRDPLPHAYLGCSSSLAAVNAAPGPGCGGVSKRVALGGLETYDVEAVGPALLVMRDNFTPSWTASVDGLAAGVVRANGWQRAVPVPTGRHRVILRYDPPGLVSGVAGTIAASILALLLWARPILAATDPEAPAR